MKPYEDNLEMQNDELREENERLFEITVVMQAEVMKLKAINKELLEACKELCKAMKLTKPGDALPEQFAAYDIATQAIAKAEEK